MPKQQLPALHATSEGDAHKVADTPLRTADAPSAPVPPEVPETPGASLGEVATLFLKLGCIAFGGPAAHIALMRNEVVQRRKWVSEQTFLDLLGASNLIPGPTSTELAIYLGYRLAGPPGLILAGTLFILPAMLIVLAIAWAYVQYGSLPQAQWLLYGVKPVIIAVILQALWGLGKTAVKGPLLAALGIAVLALYLLGVNPLLLLFGGALLVMLAKNAQRWRSGGAARAIIAWPLLRAPGGGFSPAALAAQTAPGLASFTLLGLFLTFLKIGAVLYGSGYVLLAFLHDDFVTRLGWLTDQQLVDAVAVGQFTPGPVFTTATFIGYVMGGLSGALLSTVAIFLPSFVFVAAVYPLVPRLRRSPWMSGLLDGANVAAIGLMAAVTLTLARTSLVDWLTTALALIAAALLIRWKVNSAWLILGGGAAGIAYHLLAG